MPTPTKDELKQEILEEFWEKVFEVARDSHWGEEQDGPIHEFGMKTQRGDEIFQVTDFGNIAKWLSQALDRYAEGKVGEERKRTLNLIASLCLADHMGDAIEAAEEALKQMGIAPAYEYEDWHELSHWLHVLGAKTMWGTELGGFPCEVDDCPIDENELLALLPTPKTEEKKP